MRILGIDPGLANVGFGVIEHAGGQSRLIASGCIVTEASVPLADRLKQIHDSLVDVIALHSPEAASIEQLFFCANVKTAISVAQGRGVCILATANAGIAFHEYTPLQIKLAITGSGKAGKAQVQKMVKALLNLREAPVSDHAADALAAALCHAHSWKFTRLAEAAAVQSRPGPARLRMR